MGFVGELELGNSCEGDKQASLLRLLILFTPEASLYLFK